MMETADNVARKYGDCWDGTKQRTIYVWNINKIFCVGSPLTNIDPNTPHPPKKKLHWLVLLKFIFNQHLRHCVYVCVCVL